MSLVGCTPVYLGDPRVNAWVRSAARGSNRLGEDHWVLADLIGKAAHIRTVPVPDWVKSANRQDLMSTTTYLLASSHDSDGLDIL